MTLLEVADTAHCCNQNQIHCLVVVKKKGTILQVEKHQISSWHV